MVDSILGKNGCEMMAWLLTEKEARTAMQLSPQRRNPLIENWEIIAQAQLDKVLKEQNEALQDYIDDKISLVQLPKDRPIQCPFCGEGDFDLVGLKYHLERYCRDYIAIAGEK